MIDVALIVATAKSWLARYGAPLYMSPDVISPSVTHFLHEKGIMGPQAYFFSAEYFVAQMPLKQSVEGASGLDVNLPKIHYLNLMPCLPQ